MNDEIQQPDDAPEGSFEELLKQYETDRLDQVQVGEQIKGAIVAIGQESVFVDTGTKIDGVVERAELQDDSGQMPHKIGDTLELYVVAASEHEIRLSRSLSGQGDYALLQDAFDRQIPVDGKVAAAIKGGYQVELLKRRAFCPASQMDQRYTKDTAEHIGQSYAFLITRIEDRGRNIVVSRRRLLERDQAKTRQAFLAELKTDQIIEGQVTRLMPYGAFVQLTPGLEGMVHISEISWSRLEKPSDQLQEGQSVQVKVLAVVKQDNSDQVKIALSIKQITGDPWQQLPGHLQAGAKLKGRVTRCVSFGAFVEISPGIEGLVHISEMSYTQRVLAPQDIVKIGQQVYVLIKSIDPVARRVSLSIKDAQGDPWENIEQNYSVGQTVQGTLTKKENFGLFVTLEPGITGLLPQSKIGLAGDPQAIERLKPGDGLMVKIERIEPLERKISLAPSGDEASLEWRQFRTDTSASLGSLGEKLQQAFKQVKKS